MTSTDHKVPGFANDSAATATYNDDVQLPIGDHIYTFPCLVLPTKSIREFENLVSVVADDKPPFKPPLRPIVRQEGTEYRLLQPAACFSDCICRHMFTAVVCGIVPNDLAAADYMLIENYLRALPAGPTHQPPPDAARMLAFNQCVIDRLAEHFKLKVGPALYRALVGDGLSEKSADNVSADARVRSAWNPIAQKFKFPDYDALLELVPGKFHARLRSWLLDRMKNKREPQTIWKSIEKRFVLGDAK